MNERRYQECGRIEKIWRMRHYIKIPFRWLRWKISDKDQEFNNVTYWKLLIGVSQSEMRWYYTQEEMELMFLNHFSSDEEE